MAHNSSPEEAKLQGYQGRTPVHPEAQGWRHHAIGNKIVHDHLSQAPGEGCDTLNLLYKGCLCNNVFEMLIWFSISLCYRFAVPLHTTDIQLKIENCNTLKYDENGTEFWDNSSYCPITVSISSKRLPKNGAGGDAHVNCENHVAGCILNVSKSAVGEIHYLRVDLQEQFNSSVQFEASFSIEGML